jgi:hypothetical protein
MSLEQCSTMKERLVFTKIQMSVQRVTVDLEGRVINKQKITCLRPPILQMLVMNFHRKGLLKQ